MRSIFLSILLSCLLLACGRKTRYCECRVTEIGTKTSVTSLSIPFAASVGDTIVENYVYNSTTVSEHEKASRKNMIAACPVKVEEPIYDRTTFGASQEGIPGVPLSVQLMTVIENKGTRTRTCEITD